MMKARLIEAFRGLLQPVLAVVLGLSLGLAVTAFAGENPFHVFMILVKSAVGTGYDLGMTLFYATPLIFSGLSVAVAFHAGLFNIGAEGQLVLGALSAAAVGILCPDVPGVLAPILATVVAFSVGALWGAIPGWLRAKRGSHEVINTIMMNFLAASIGSYVTGYLLKNPESQNPETAAIAAQYILPNYAWMGDAPLSFAFPLALICAFGVSYFLWKTVPGYQIRAVGENETAARKAGINSVKARILAMSLAGGLAGLVATSEVLGNAHRYKHAFSPGYGFIGIAVALLGRNRPIGVVFAGLLFGALHKGTAALDFETENVTRDLSQILQALVILAVAADGLWDFLKRRKRVRA